MATEIGSISPSYKKFLQAARAQSGDGNPSPPSAPPPSGNSGTGDGNSGSSGGGSNPPPGSGSPSASSGSGSGSGKWSAKQWILFCAILISTACTIWMIMWRTSAPGLKQEEQQKTLDSKDLDLKLKKEHTKQMRIAERSGQSLSQPVAQNDCLDPRDIVSHWSKPIHIGTGQCIKFSSGTQREFWIRLASSPTLLAGKASFAEFKRPESLDEKMTRKQACLAKGESQDFCDAEAQQSRGLRKDECYGVPAADQCLGYLQGKINASIHVYAMDLEIQTSN